MKSVASVVVILALAAFVPATANPIDKIISMISDLEVKVIEEGKVSAS
jgi:hypothetical protein